MSLKKEFVRFAHQDGANVAELCRRFGISRKTGYKWLNRTETAGLAGLEERSRRPHHSPSRVSEAVEEAVLALRQKHPVWGGRKLRARLLALGVPSVPSASTITAILRRHNLLNAAEAHKHQPYLRFEHEEPNQLWQMDFKGHFATGAGRCHPLTVLDDHSRYALCLWACPNEQAQTAQAALIQAFRRYGLPERMTMDNGGPWGHDADCRYTRFTAWLIRLGIRVGHSSPYHPQTQGKDERFHRTLKAELLNFHTFRDLEHCQEYFDRWREVYNCERPNQAIGDATPQSRYQVSWRPYPETLPSIEYGPDDCVRKVCDKGMIAYRGRKFRISKGFAGLPVAIRPTSVDGVLEVYFCHTLVAEIDLRVTG